MGVLRLCLALSVVMAHTQPVLGFHGMGGSAVPAFLILSGFYMHMVLDERYTARTGAFLLNRLLRLCPMYWATVLIMLVVAQYPSGTSELAARFHAGIANSVARATDGSTASLLAAIPNLLIVGNEVVRQTLVDDSTGTIRWWPTGMIEGMGLSGGYQYLLLPQAWSLSVELSFYALTPLLVMRSTAFLATLAALAAFVNVTGLLWTTTAWHNLSSSFNLGYFLLGLLAWRLRDNLTARAAPWQRLCAIVPLVLWAAWQPLARIVVASDWLLWLPFAATLPCLSKATSKNRLDRRIGELSYPIYLVHSLFTYPAMAYGSLAAIPAVGLSVMLAIVMLIFIDAPVQAIRRRVAQSRPTV